MEYRVHLSGMEEGEEQLENTARRFQQDIEGCREVVHNLRQMTSFDEIAFCISKAENKLEDQQQELLSMTATLSRVIAIYRLVENQLIDQVEEGRITSETGKVVGFTVGEVGIFDKGSEMVSGADWKNNIKI